MIYQLCCFYSHEISHEMGKRGLFRAKNRATWLMPTIDTDEYLHVDPKVFKGECSDQFGALLVDDTTVVPQFEFTRGAFMCLYKANFTMVFVCFCWWYIELVNGLINPLITGGAPPWRGDYHNLNITQYGIIILILLGTMTTQYIGDYDNYWI